MNKTAAEKILSLAGASRAGAAEAFLRARSSVTIEVKDQKIDALDLARDAGAGLRVFADGRMGFAFTTDLTDEGLRALADAAVTNARNAAPDPFQTLPPKPAEAYPAVAVYDAELDRLTEEERIARVMAMERAAFAVDPRIKRTRKTSAVFSSAETVILNSAGSEVFYRSTACSSSIEVVAEDKGESQAGSDFDVNRFYRKLEIEETARRAAQRALDLLGARRLDSVRAPVILDAPVAQEFLAIAAGGLSAENVQKKKSLFLGKLDTMVASPIVTIYDDGLLSGGLGTAPSDDEAVPLKKKTVVEDGRLALFLHNTCTANKDRTLSTGNGMRGGFKGVPGVGITNLYIDPGECTLGGIIKQVEKGLLVTEVMGMHTANPVSGDFSVGATGFWIEDGKKAFPVREITIAGNVPDLLRHVEVVGCDIRFAGRIGSPSLLIKELSIAGK